MNICVYEYMRIYTLYMKVYVKSVYTLSHKVCIYIYTRLYKRCIYKVYKHTHFVDKIVDKAYLSGQNNTNNPYFGECLLIAESAVDALKQQERVQAQS